MSNSSMQAPTPGQPIPLPPDFQVRWDDPRDAKLTWMTIPQFKTPISPLIHAVVAAFMVGGNAGFDCFEGNVESGSRGGGRQNVIDVRPADQLRRDVRGTLRRLDVEAQPRQGHVDVPRRDIGGSVDRVGDRRAADLDQ